MGGLHKIRDGLAFRRTHDLPTHPSIAPPATPAVPETARDLPARPALYHQRPPPRRKLPATSLRRTRALTAHPSIASPASLFVPESDHDLPTRPSIASPATPAAPESVPANASAPRGGTLYVFPGEHPGAAPPGRLSPPTRRVFPRARDGRAAMRIACRGGRARRAKRPLKG